jgi:hypothetical protein
MLLLLLLLLLLNLRRANGVCSRYFDILEPFSVQQEGCRVERF